MFCWLQKSKGWSTRTVRQVAQSLAFGGTSTLLLMCAYLSNVWASYTCLVFAQGVLGATQSGLSCVVLDISPRYSARFFSVCNMIGAVGGIAGPLIVSVFVEKYPDDGKTDTLTLSTPRTLHYYLHPSNC